MLTVGGEGHYETVSVVVYKQSLRHYKYYCRVGMLLKQLLTTMSQLQ